MMKMDKFCALVFQEPVEGFGYIVEPLFELISFKTGLISSVKIYKIGVEENGHALHGFHLAKKCRMLNLYNNLKRSHGSLFDSSSALSGDQSRKIMMLLRTHFGVYL